MAGNRPLLAGLASRLGLARPTGPDCIALGTFCHVAAALREAGLRRWTGPFDWIFSTPAMIAACLADGCAALLDSAELASVPPAELTAGAARQCRHPRFEAAYDLPTIFNHHDPAAEPRDAAALARAAERLRQALGPGRANVLLMMSERRWPEPELAGLARHIAGLPSRNTLVVLTAEGGATRSGWSVEADATDGAFRRIDIRLGVRSRSLGVRFADPADDAYLREVLPVIARAAVPPAAGLRPAACPPAEPAPAEPTS
ncbi:MAG: hypothetical protein JO048_03065 [Methylobacteriaceae bacterium]|nr:hypothetical protein [Methylobacteriaceae bacterium]